MTLYTYRNSGFTLIEMAVVLLILSVLMGTGLSYLTARSNQEKYDLTLKRMAKVEEALWQFRRARNTLPCPAARNQIVSNDAYGVAVSGANCSDSGTPGNGTYRSPSDLTAGGAVPHMTLGLPAEYAFDGWGRKFNYVVTVKMTATDAFGASHPISDMTAGEIIMRDGSSGSPTFGNNLITDQNAVYALISLGKRGHGGYTRTGTVISSSTSSLIDPQNCRCDSQGNYVAADNIYIQAPMNTNTTSNYYFDDIVHYKTRAQLYSPAGLGQINAESPPVTGFN